MVEYFGNCKSQSERKKLWRKLAATHHPDKGGDSEVFQEIQRQYEAAMPVRPERAKVTTSKSGGMFTGMRMDASKEATEAAERRASIASIVAGDKALKDPNAPDLHWVRERDIIALKSGMRSAVGQARYGYRVDMDCWVRLKLS